MIKDEKINDMVFLEQTTYYIYRTEEDRKNDLPFLTTSNKETFDEYKNAAHEGLWKLNKEPKYDTTV